MSKLTVIMNGFARDEDGRLQIVPMKLPESMSKPPACAKSSEKKVGSVRRKFIPIQPMKFDFVEENTVSPLKKKAKLARPVRKELFKAPQTKQERRSSSYGGRHSVARVRTKLNSGRKINQPKKQEIICSDGSPLLDVDEAERFISENKQLLKPVKTVLFPMIPEELNSTLNIKVTPVKSPPLMHEKMPSSLESDLEFQQLEKQLASVKKTNKKEDPASPVTAVCNLEDSTKITATQKPPINEVLCLVKESTQQINLLRQKFGSEIHILQEQFNSRIFSLQREFNSELEEHQNKLTRIVELLETVNANKENSRRSFRIGVKSARKTMVSPAVSKKEDLRKSILNKNLSTTLQNESPRTRKAADMYNTMRIDCSILCTPKLDHLNTDLQQASVTRSLSRRIQKQCLLLQDTPKPLL